MVAGPPYRGIEWIDSLEQLPVNRQLIQYGLTQVAVWLAERAVTRRLTLLTLLDLHRVTFGRVFPEFAGRLRGPAPAHIPQNVTFGRFRGVVYAEVLDACGDLFVRIDQLIGQLDRSRGVWSYHDLQSNTLRAAAYVHCELVRIHPFVNGNGRIARMAINYFAHRYGLPVIGFDQANDEYFDATGAWLEQRTIDPFTDFLRSRCLPFAGDEYS